MSNDLVISSGVSKAFRNVVDMATGAYPNNDGGKVILKDNLELSVPPARATIFVNMFMSWYRNKYHSTDTRPDFILQYDLQQQPPLLVCGILTEFADAVDQALAVARVATYAAEVIERFGWVQGDSGGKNRGFCLLGSLDYAICHSGMNDAQQFNMWKLTKSLLHELLQTSLLVYWNDAPGRTAGEVTHLLREVAAAAGLRIIKP